MAKTKREALEHPAKKSLMNKFRSELKGVYRDRKKKTEKYLVNTQLCMVDVEGRNEGTGKKKGGRSDMKMMTLGQKSQFYNPMTLLRQRLQEALDPSLAPGKVRTLADMTPEERRAIESRVGARVKEKT